MGYIYGGINIYIYIYIHLQWKKGCIYMIDLLDIFIEEIYRYVKEKEKLFH